MLHRLPRMDEHDTLIQPPRRNAGRGLVVAVALLVVVAIGVAAYVFGTRSVAIEPVRDASVPSPPAPLDAEPAAPEEPVEPEVDESTGRPLSPDEVLRRVAAQGSPSPELASWFSADGVLRRIAAAVLLISQGRSPRNMLGFIQIEGTFKVVDTLVAFKGLGADRILMSEESQARYDVLSRILKGADVAAWGRGYRRLRPHFGAVFAEVAEPGQRFDDVVAAAIGRILAAKVPEGEIELEEAGAIFLFKDPALESLSEVEKHMIRLGPMNAKAVQDALRIFARSAGLPLPPG